MSSLSGRLPGLLTQYRNKPLTEKAQVVNCVEANDQEAVHANDLLGLQGLDYLAPSTGKGSGLGPALGRPWSQWSAMASKIMPAPLLR